MSLPLHTPKGMTVRELKALVSNLPEQGANGVDYEVWLGDGNGYTNPVVHAWQLNKGDLLLSHKSTREEH